MCSNDLNALSNAFDVNHTKPSPTFVLHAHSVFTACFAFTGPLPFCLLAPSTRVEQTCQATRDAYFASVLDGAVKTLADLPLVWQILKILPESKEPWIPLPNSGSK